ncbi:protein phosphatase regulator [Dimargaris verticillata]|uniref:Protein phosphatase regulator n=1 Tax=Dimargaris verticillata TaxID=2761393 RepID=A0A9W8BCI2_9FUNG|nr:protein phosphatase regulator [Dimargaris verticillata]
MGSDDHFLQRLQQVGGQQDPSPNPDVEARQALPRDDAATAGTEVYDDGAIGYSSAPGADAPLDLGPHNSFSAQHHMEQVRSPDGKTLITTIQTACAHIVTTEAESEIQTNVTLPDGQMISLNAGQVPTIVYAAFDFVRMVEGQVTVHEAEELMLLDESNQFWWLVLKDNGDIGYIPADNIETKELRLARVNRDANVETVKQRPQDEGPPTSVSSRPRGPNPNKSFRFHEDLVTMVGETYHLEDYVDYEPSDSDGMGVLDGSDDEDLDTVQRPYDGSDPRLVGPEDLDDDEGSPMNELNAEANLALNSVGMAGHEGYSSRESMNHAPLGPEAPSGAYHSYYDHALTESDQACGASSSDYAQYDRAYELDRLDEPSPAAHALQDPAQAIAQSPNAFASSGGDSYAPAATGADSQGQEQLYTFVVAFHVECGSDDPSEFAVQDEQWITMSAKETFADILPRVLRTFRLVADDPQVLHGYRLLAYISGFNFGISLAQDEHMYTLLEYVAECMDGVPAEECLRFILKEDNLLRNDAQADESPLFTHPVSEPTSPRSPLATRAANNPPDSPTTGAAGPASPSAPAPNSEPSSGPWTPNTVEDSVMETMQRITPHLPFPDPSADQLLPANFSDQRRSVFDEAYGLDDEEPSFASAYQSLSNNPSPGEAPSTAISAPEPEFADPAKRSHPLTTSSNQPSTMEATPTFGVQQLPPTAALSLALSPTLPASAPKPLPPPRPQLTLADASLLIESDEESPTTPNVQPRPATTGRRGSESSTISIRPVPRRTSRSRKSSQSSDGSAGGQTVTADNVLKNILSSIMPPKSPPPSNSAAPAFAGPGGMSETTAPTATAMRSASSIRNSAEILSPSHVEQFGASDLPWNPKLDNRLSRASVDRAPFQPKRDSAIQKRLSLKSDVEQEVLNLSQEMATPRPSQSHDGTMSASPEALDQYQINDSRLSSSASLYNMMSPTYGPQRRSSGSRPSVDNHRLSWNALMAVGQQASRRSSIMSIASTSPCVPLHQLTAASRRNSQANRAPTTPSGLDTTLQPLAEEPSLSNQSSPISQSHHLPDLHTTPTARGQGPQAMGTSPMVNRVRDSTGSADRVPFSSSDTLLYSSATTLNVLAQGGPPGSTVTGGSPRRLVGGALVATSTPAQLASAVTHSDLSAAQTADKGHLGTNANATTGAQTGARRATTATGNDDSDTSVGTMVTSPTAQPVSTHSPQRTYSPLNLDTWLTLMRGLPPLPEDTLFEPTKGTGRGHSTHAAGTLAPLDALAHDGPTHDDVVLDYLAQFPSPKQALQSTGITQTLATESRPPTATASDDSAEPLTLTRHTVLATHHQATAPNGQNATGSHTTTTLEPLLALSRSVTDKLELIEYELDELLLQVVQAF